MSDYIDGANYNTMRARYAFLRDSYWGGERYRRPSATVLTEARAWRVDIGADGTETRQSVRYDSYLVPHPKEDDESFASRLRLAAYINLVAPIVDAYAEACASRVQRQWGDVDVSDVDCKGSEWGELVESAARGGALYGWMIAVVDTPKSSAVTSLADERALGIRPRVVLVEPAAIGWIDTDELGRIKELSYVEQAYADDQTGTRFQRIRVRVIGNGRWELREATMPLGASIGPARSSFSVIDGGTLPEVLKGRAPVHVLYYRRVDGIHPLGQSLVEDAADIARLIYNALSWANETHRKAGFPFLAIPMGSTGGQADPNTRRTVGVDKAFPYDSSTGAPQWIQPSAESTSELREHCGWLFQMALRTAGLEVAADQSAQVQSGEALRIRSRDFESRASRFARNLERWERAVAADYELLSGTSGQFEATYPKTFTLPDPSEDLARAVQLLGLPVEIGPDAKVLAVMQALRSGLNLSDEKANELASKLAAILHADLSDFDEERVARKSERIARLKLAAQQVGQDSQQATVAPPTEG